MAEQNDPLRKLPEWPMEARDLPGDGPAPGPARTWLVVLGAGGAALGLLSGYGSGGGDWATAAGGAVGLGLIGALVGYLVDRTVWNSARKRGP